MAPSLDDTLRNLERPTIVVVGGSRDLLESCKEISRSGVPAAVVSCDLGSVTTTVAARRPFAIVVPEALIAFDEGEFRALARDVRAQIISVPDENHARTVLASLLFTPLKRALLSWTL
jgi:hypothetical protein